MSSEYTPDEILELARRRVAEQRTRSHDLERDRRGGRDGLWRAVFLSLLVAGLLGIALVPSSLPLNMRLYAVVHGICAQQHNEFLGALQLPLCARNTGIYAAFLVTIGYLALLGRGRAARIPPLSISLFLALLVLIMAADGFNSLFKDIGAPYFYEPFNALRTLTGLGLGVAMGVFVLLILNSALRLDARSEQRIVGSWLELAGALGLSLLMLVIIYAELTWGFWLVAAVSFFGITGVLFLINTLVIALFMGYEASVTRWSQLARPATFALLVTALMLGSTSYLRFWLEASGFMPPA